MKSTMTETCSAVLRLRRNCSSGGAERTVFSVFAVLFPLNRRCFYPFAGCLVWKFVSLSSQSFCLANNTSVSTSTSIQFRRAGRQGQTRTLTAATKRLITHYVLHFHVGVVLRCHGLHFQSTHTTEVSSANHTWNWVIGSPGQWVIWVIFHVRVTGSPGHHFDPVWDPSFYRFSKKCPKCKTYFWNAEMTKVIVRCLLYWNHWMSVHDWNELLLLPVIIKNYLAREYCFTHKSTFGVHYRTGSPGHLGLWVAGFPGNRVAGSQNVTQFYVW